MYLLDTNICIYLMKNKYPELTDHVLSCSNSDFAISSVTLFELEYGASKSNWGEQTHTKMVLFLAPFTIIPFDSEDAMASGRIRGFLTKKGNMIGPYDIMIAGQALSKKMTVITHNTKEFERVPGLLVEDWIV